MTKAHIHLIITGGTIDSVFDPSRDTVLVNDASVLAEHITRLIRPHFTLTQNVVTMKDSRQITDHTRADMVAAIEASPTKNIVLTHGTYTMAATASYLKRESARFPDKVVVLTGGFYPLKGFSDTDAPFNLGFACASALQASAGVYVAMNGRLFPADTVAKDLEKGRFEPVR